MYEKEKVLVVPTNKIQNICNNKTGLISVPEYDIISIIEKYGYFVDREKAENDETTRQVIPYIILRENNKYLLFKRTTAQGEKRLHNKITIGVGGHINSTDSIDPVKAFKKGMIREINEEVNVEILNLNYIGVINVTDNPVSRVHVGLCYIADVKYFGLMEKEKFIELFTENPSKYFEEMEGWSKVVVQSLDHMQK
ncbi:DNA mismatch repair protein MutT [Thermosipho melanesiensis]|uniref:Phosphoesterase (MutT family)-like protein n=2 Tax=Thermosipho melanesiensis TaxID=46541 RepID=A6LJT8_THEM4|nr:DNA mismatch repair protein MutT [Thermosipho melanesiensis]ABR30189.1 phosphoesterase (MutT family)-like protein [Thermosipho melanesiensis BI429]APT73388.1 DNA mismatch repair protein MutT [Thermosipho melanesiensis]OOC38201.1 DNA mismatch repair protein MutT [Thermosipho melanesiensis]OOC40122.1 DNA mismatch repair protein MutT [Thermosipho melanesiensis]OOC40174.1 DNA mismatch repair protein MutT [Thermosipho melanesiensis]